MIWLLDTLEVSANHAFLVILAIEVDEDKEEDNEDDDTDTGHHSWHHGAGLDLDTGLAWWQNTGPVLSVASITGGGVSQVTLGLVPVLSQSVTWDID